MTKKNKTRLIYILIAVLMLLGVAAVVGYVRKKKTDTPALNPGTDTAAQRKMKARALSELGQTQYMAT